MKDVWDGAEVGHQSSLVKPAAKNGVGFFVAGRCAGCKVDQFVEREVAALLCKVGGCRFLFLNVHLPDNDTLKKRGTTLQEILTSIHSKHTRPGGSSMDGGI